jgi:hypothetical protein
MSLLAAIRGKKLRSLTLQLCTLLLAFYVTGPSQFELLHKLIHTHDHSVSHTEMQEEDPCHRSIYHNDIEKGCGHHSHIVVTDKCELCDLISHTDQILLSKSESIRPQFFSFDFNFCSTEVVSIGHSILPSRAPPTNS